MEHTLVACTRSVRIPMKSTSFSLLLKRENSPLSGDHFLFS